MKKNKPHTPMPTEVIHRLLEFRKDRLLHPVAYFIPSDEVLLRVEAELLMSGDDVRQMIAIVRASDTPYNFVSVICPSRHLPEPKDLEVCQGLAWLPFDYTDLATLSLNLDWTGDVDTFELFLLLLRQFFPIKKPADKHIGALAAA